MEKYNDLIGRHLVDLLNVKQENINLLAKYGIKIENQSMWSHEHMQSFVLNIDKLEDLRVACVMDRFTLDSYSPECNILEVTPGNWKEEIDNFVPHMLFIESAWKGKEDLWYRKIANGSKEYFEMTSYCHEKNIPVVFWNKEDPIYTDTFMVAARMADYIFTTDIDCIEKYKRELKNDNVFLLHFAAQPKLHNPIEKFERKDKFCFAGAYYHRYPKRAKVFDGFSKVFIETKGFDIYDRNYKNSLPEHAFPKSYDKYILGKLDPSEIDVAYKGYNYGVNMNSVNQSQTMFARRVFEMLASNTVTVGNYSRGVKNLFGDLTICTDDETTLMNDLKKYCLDEITFRKYRLLGLRKVLNEHLYEDRLSYIVDKVFGREIKKVLPKIIMISTSSNESSLNRIINMFNKQTYNNKLLYIISDSFESDSENIISIRHDQAKEFKVSSFGNNTFVTTFSETDYYGENYLLDLALTTRYGNYDVIGKSGYYEFDNEKFSINTIGNTYKAVETLNSCRSILNCEAFSEYNLYDLANSIEIKNHNSFSIDEFNYCMNYCESSCDEVDDLLIHDKGLTMKSVDLIGEEINIKSTDVKGKVINAEEIYKIVKSTENILFSLKNNEVIIKSKLNAETHEYVYFDEIYNISDFQKDNTLSLKFNSIGDLDLTCVCVFYDKKQNKIKPIFTQCNRLLNAEIPNNAETFKLGIRPRGSGFSNLKSIDIDTDLSNTRNSFLSRSKTLVLTNHYPKAEDLYRNMFVHKRLMAYKEAGNLFDVMRMNMYANDEYREFEGINIVEGQSAELANILERGNIDTVCVHFLDTLMWTVLKNYLDKIKIIIWSHGSDIQPWWRREYIYQTEEELKEGKKQSESRMNLWNEVFDMSKGKNIHFVFVSQYAADIVMEDYKRTIPSDKYSIIHNCIDTNMFSYIEKDSEQRKKIVSIRPYASTIYGNDIMVKTILELSKNKYFNELTFTVIGDGILFNKITKPLKKYKNVILRKEFLRQQDIANLYKEHGIALIPTRGDTQGVSRDEAMSSGLVPITNSVAAIPEFVDESCGMTVDNEDYIAMAQAIETLFYDEKLYCDLSENAAKRVRMQTSKEYTISKELKLINNR